MLFMGSYGIKREPCEPRRRVGLDAYPDHELGVMAHRRENRLERKAYKLACENEKKETMRQQKTGSTTSMIGKSIHSCHPCPKISVSLCRPVGLLLSASRVRTAIHYYLVRPNSIKAFVQEHERVKK